MRRHGGTLDWYWIIVTGGTLAGCLIILIVALWLVVCPGAAEAYEPPDESVPPYYPHFLPPWKVDPDSLGGVGRWGWDQVLLGIEPVEDNPFRSWYSKGHIIAIPCVGRGVVRNGGWPYEEAPWYSWDLAKYRPFIGDRGRR